MYGPAVCCKKLFGLAVAGLHQCIRASDWSVLCSGDVPAIVENGGEALLALSL